MKPSLVKLRAERRESDKEYQVQNKRGKKMRVL
jgi:hypothetical protein